jgi:hypothetical protein
MGKLLKWVLIGLGAIILLPIVGIGLLLLYLEIDYRLSMSKAEQGAEA